MSTTFTLKPEQDYYISKYVGRLTDNDLVHPWQEFFEGGEWVPGMNKLADLSEMDGQDITFDGLMPLAKYVTPILKENCKSVVKMAVYSPNDLPFGIARMYEAMPDESVQKVCVFRVMQEAEEWVT